MCGDGAIATGDGAVSVGPSATANGAEAVAIGTQAEATGINTLAIGSEARALNTNATAIGREALATGEYTVAIGSGARAEGNLATSVGNNALARQFDVALGAGALLFSTGSEATVAVGYGAGQGARDVERSVFTGSFSGASSSGRQNVFGGRYSGAAASGNDNVGQGTAAGALVTGNNNVAIGNQAGTLARLDADGNPIAFAGTTFSDAVNIGAGAAGLADNAIAIGATAAAGVRSIAIGTGTQASGTQAISIGTGNIVSGNNSGALGDPNIVDGSGSYAVGNNNSIAADNAFVLGNDVSIAAGLDGAVALGNGATVEAAVGTASTSISGTTYQFAGTAPVATVSVGANNAERTITHVAAGRISDTSTDAINGSQLQATNRQVTLNSALIAAQGESVASAIGGSSSYDPSTGQVTAALTVGGNSYSNVNDAINAIGGVASAGWNIQANGGPASNVPANGTLNVAAGSNVAVTLSGNRLEVAVVDAPRFNGMVTANGGLTVAAGQTVNMGGNTVRNVAAGEVSAASTDAVNGSQLYTVQQVANNAVQYDAGRNSVTFNPGGSAAVLHNVAAGVAPTDAVNVAQLNSGLDQTLARSKQYTDQQLANLNANFGIINRDIRAGAAGALAAAGLPQAFEPGKGMLAFGAGTYGGEQAFAFGLSRVMDDARTVVKAGGSINTRNKAGANIGIGFQF